MNKLLLLFALLALAGSAAAVDAYTQNLLLNLHNIERSCVGLKNLTWDASIAASAQKWSDYLATNNKFQHSGDPYGENIATASIRNNVVSFMFSMWSDEKKSFSNAKPFPDVSTDGGAVGHYTQLIWSMTYAVGCGVSNSSSGMSYLVCQYNLAGNYIGNYVYKASDIVQTPNCNPGASQPTTPTTPAEPTEPTTPTEPTEPTTPTTPTTPTEPTTPTTPTEPTTPTTPEGIDVKPTNTTTTPTKTTKPRRRTRGGRN